jgi:GT2 family glycosyltransferase
VSGVTLSIVIVNWNVCGFLRDCLRSLHDQMLMARGSWEVIVVDNASDDGSVEMIRREFPEAALLANDENVGFARANNQGFAISRGRYVLLLNPDTIVLDHAVDAMVRRMKARPEVAALGCHLVNADGSFQRWTGGNPPGKRNVACHFLLAYRFLPARILPPPLYLERKPALEIEVGWVSGACMLLRREAVAGGLFDERFFIYGEDMELCGRLAAAGWKVAYTPVASIVHHEGRSVDQHPSDVMKVNKLRALRRIFASRNGRGWLLYYDIVVLAGFFARSVAFGLATLARPGRYGAAAARSRRYLGESARVLIRGPRDPDVSRTGPA